MKLIWMRGGYQSSVRDLGMLLFACKVKAEMFLLLFFFSPPRKEGGRHYKVK